jgi:hypothetical protein
VANSKWQFAGANDSGTGQALIRVDPPVEPPDFETKVAQSGYKWLMAHPESKKRPPDYWSQCVEALQEGFGGRCAYAAMLDPTGGTVDHYYSWNNFPYLAYEWENYRFVCAPINSSKKDLDDDVLDPYDVGDGWFEILLPSLQLVVTGAVPDAFRAKAEFTLMRLKLGNGARLIKWRQSWYRMYQDGKLTLQGLRDVAPLIAAAVEKQDRPE